MSKKRCSTWDEILDSTVVFSYSNVGYWLRKPFWKKQKKQDSQYSRRGQLAVVTGANSGLGLETARQLAGLGVEVWMLVRDIEKGLDARSYILQQNPEANLKVKYCDLGDLASVRQFALEFQENGAGLDLLVNNAGILIHERKQSVEGIEMTFAVNVLGGFLLTELLVPALQRSGESRVIAVSSGGMYTQKVHLDDLYYEKEPFDGVAAYARSKRAQVLLTEEWSERYRQTGISFHSMHPGWVFTPGVKKSLPAFTRLMRPFLRTLPQGADTIVWLSISGPDRLGSGGFWFDRCQRKTIRLHNTRNSLEERRRLWEICRELSGLGEAT